MRFHWLWSFVPAALLGCATASQATREALRAKEAQEVQFAEDTNLPPKNGPSDAVVDLEQDVTKDIRRDIAAVADRLVQEERSQRVRVDGVVSSIDPDDERVTVVDPRGVPSSVQLSNGTKLLGEDTTLNLGDEVRTVYRLDENGRYAESIEILEPRVPIEE